MKRSMTIILSAVVVVLIAIAFYQNFAAHSKPAVSSDQGALKVGEAAPSFTLTGLDGKTYQVGGERDKPLFVNFWASWCDPCQKEAPDLVQNAEKYGGQYDMLAINVTNLDVLDSVKQFVKQFGYTFPVLLDRKGKVSDLYKVYNYPMSFLIDKKGVIRDILLGQQTPKVLEQRILKLIKESQGVDG